MADTEGEAGAPLIETGLPRPAAPLGEPTDEDEAATKAALSAAAAKMGVSEAEVLQDRYVLLPDRYVRARLPTVCRVCCVLRVLRAACCVPRTADCMLQTAATSVCCARRLAHRTFGFRPSTVGARGGDADAE